MNPLLNFVLFIFSPLLGFVISLINKRNKLSGFIFLFFFFLIGCSFSFHDISVDSYRYAIDFGQVKTYNLETVWFDRLLQGRIDLYDFLVSCLIGKFTDSARFLYAFYAVFYGYFILKFIHFVCDDWGKGKDVYIWIIILVIFFLNPHMNINGVRFWTATWVFFTTFLAYCLYHKNKWILGFIVTPLIHISFLLPLCFMIVSFVFYKHFKLKTLYYLAIISFVIGIILPVDKIIEMLPVSFGVFEHFEAYTEEGYVSEMAALKQERSTLNVLFSRLPFVYVFVLLIHLKNKPIIYEYNTFFVTFILLFLSFLFVVDKIPSMGRFYYLAYMFLIYLTFRIYKYNRSKFIQRLILLAPILFFGKIYQIYVIHDLVLSNIYLYRPTWDIINFALSYKLQ